MLRSLILKDLKSTNLVVLSICIHLNYDLYNWAFTIIRISIVTILTWFSHDKKNYTFGGKVLKLEQYNVTFLKEHYIKIGQDFVF